MVYEFAGAAGRSIEELKRLSLWEFTALKNGWVQANTPPDEDGKPRAPSEAEFEAVLERFG